MKKLFVLAFAALAVTAISCNKDNGSSVATGGNATPATNQSILGNWVNPAWTWPDRETFDYQFKADGTVTGDMITSDTTSETVTGTWSIDDKGVLAITTGDKTFYTSPYTLYDNTVLLLRYDIPDIALDGSVTWDNGKGYVEIFYKDGTCSANDINDLQGTWLNRDTWEYDDGSGNTVTESNDNVKLIVNGNNFEITIYPWQSLYKGTCTYSHGMLTLKVTYYVSHGQESDPATCEIQGETFPFIANANEAYGYLVEARGAWEKL